MKDEKARSSDKRTQQQRRGATLVFVAVLMTVVMMFAGIGIDFSRMYTYKAQLKVLADAAALSGLTDLKNGVAEATAKTRAVGFKSNNKVNNQVAVLDATDIVPVQYNFANGTWAVSSWASANGVLATPRYTADWTLARVFGVSTRTLRDSSIAAIVGSYTSSACMVPIAIPYSNLLRAINPANVDTSRTLTPADIAILAANNTQIQLTGTQNGSGDMLSPGWFSLINFGDGNGNKKDVAASLIDALNGCTVGNSVSVGDWIDVVTGGGGWNGKPNDDLWEDLCDSSNANKNKQLENCQRTIQIPVVNAWNGNSGTGAAWQIEYIAAIKLTKIVPPTGAAKPAEVWGYFTTDKSGGSNFSPFPGPVQASSLVK